VPANWSDAAFSGFVAQGGFAVSSVLAGGRVSFFNLSAPFIAGPLTVSARVAVALPAPLQWLPASASVVVQGDGDVAVTFQASETVTVWSAAAPPASFAVAPIPHPPASWNHFGLHN
jgi:hypothetical protein